MVRKVPGVEYHGCHSGWNRGLAGHETADTKRLVHVLRTAGHGKNSWIPQATKCGPVVCKQHDFSIPSLYATIAHQIGIYIRLII
jgi:hypothetical protein